MNGLHQAVGLGGDDGAGGQLAIRPSPMVDEPGEHENPVPHRTDEVGGLGPADGLPLVEAAGWNETPTMAQSASKGRLGGDPFSPGVDGLGAALGVLGPAGHEAPASKYRDSLAALGPHCGKSLSFEASALMPRWSSGLRS